jgi:adenylate cyclase
MKARRSDPDHSVLMSTSVDRLVQESEIEAEYAIGWVRIVLALVLLASGFLLWSGAAGLTEEHRPNQMLTALITVSAFFGLGIISFFLVVRRWFKAWMAFVLAAGDATILAGSLYFGLKGTQLGGNWIAAMPAIWAAPLILAVGTLRHRALVQIWATAAMMVAVFGVALALGFHPVSTDFGTTLSPSNLEASLGRLFSLPPYLMRAVMLTLIGLVTALAMTRSRHLLMRAVGETARRTNLARFLPAEIAPLLEENHVAAWRQGRLQQATILFVDIRGFTAFAEKMDPARLSVFISSFRRRVTRAVEAHEGLVDKFVGDGALVVFGIPEPRGDDCTRALACAHEILALVDQWNIKRGFNPPVRVGIGIHTGEVYCGLVGDDRRLEFTVLGDTVNVAAKIEQATKRFNAALLASENVVIQTGQRDMWQEVGREPLVGRGEHLAIFSTRGRSLAAAARSDPAVFNCY